MQLPSGITILGNDKGGHVRCYLIQHSKKLILLDAGYDQDASTILAGLAALRKKPRDISDILITHGHKSHIGGLAEIQRRSGARVHTHEWEALIIRGFRKAERVGFPKLSEKPKNWTVRGLQAALWAGLGSHAPCAVDRTLKDGQRIGPLTVIHTPGHTPGSLSFWHSRLKVVFCADTICTWPEVGAWEGFTTDLEAWRDSIDKLAALPAQILCSGHGDPLGNAQNVIRSLQSS